MEKRSGFVEEWVRGSDDVRWWRMGEEAEVDGEEADV